MRYLVWADDLLMRFWQIMRQVIPQELKVVPHYVVFEFTKKALCALFLPEKGPADGR